MVMTKIMMMMMVIIVMIYNSSNDNHHYQHGGSDNDYKIIQQHKCNKMFHTFNFWLNFNIWIINLN